jgi:hypothetical protein
MKYAFLDEETNLEATGACRHATISHPLVDMFVCFSWELYGF